VDGPVLALNVLFVVLSDAAFALLVGCLLAARWLDAADLKHSSRMLRRLCVACAGAMILNHLVRPWFAGASMSGSSSFAGNLALIPEILTSTHQGKLWYINSAVLVALLAATLVAARSTRHVVVWPFLVCLFLIAGTKASSGHAGNGGDFTLEEFSMFVHVLGTAVWAGTVVASGLLVVPRLAEFPDPTALWSHGNLLSRTVTWALLAIFVSAVFTSDRELNGALSGLWRSNWGEILMTKIAFVSLALILGACTRFQCVKRSATSQRAALMVRLMRIEALVMMVVLALSGILANTPPAMTEAARAANQSCLLYPRPRIT
jgi:putative copper resistance protein D